MYVTDLYDTLVFSCIWKSFDLFLFFLNYCVCVLFLKLNSDKMFGEKARWELQKAAAGCFKQILEAATVRPLTSYLTNHPSKMSKIWVCHSSAVPRISDFLLWIPMHGYTSVGLPVNTYICQVCADTGCCLEDLLGEIVSKNKGNPHRQHNLMKMCVCKMSQ